MGFSGTPKDMGPLKMVSFPILFPNTTPIRIPKRYGNSMGNLPFKGVPLLGVPENTVDQSRLFALVSIPYL